ncbi:MAG: AGE family epimerase/isomerase [Lachnospiraceae bacterium]|nr:AGE family epimerase/isomerase [Lachnospiraceae bacterium]
MSVSKYQEHLEKKLLPFWQSLKDEEFGGYYGYMGEDLQLEKKADKGCILNSRILWFFSTAARVLGRDDLRSYADHAYRFLKQFEDEEHGGVYWSVSYDGKPADTTKHTYCQAFAVYGLAAYYRLTGNPEVLEKAAALFRVIETRCRDDGGYLEALKADFSPESNEKLSENGIMASRTMNTLLHVLEAYAELCRANTAQDVRAAGVRCLEQFLHTVYNPEKRRMEVFFDAEFHPLLDMQSYGHDIEGSWLIWDAAETFLPEEEREPWKAMCLDLLQSSTERAFTDHGLHYEIVGGEVNTIRAWWPQAEAMLGFAFGRRMTDDPAWDTKMQKQWDYIMRVIVDPRENSEWFNEIREDGTSIGKPILEEWKCPYHNGRMCLQLLEEAG